MIIHSDTSNDTSDTSSFFLLVSRSQAHLLNTDTRTLVTLVFFQLCKQENKTKKPVCNNSKFTSVTSVVVSTTNFVPKKAVFLTLVVFFYWCQYDFTSVKVGVK